MWSLCEGIRQFLNVCFQIKSSTQIIFSYIFVAIHTWKRAFRASVGPKCGLQTLIEEPRMLNRYALILYHLLSRAWVFESTHSIFPLAYLFGFDASFMFLINMWCWIGLIRRSDSDEADEWCHIKKSWPYEKGSAAEVWPCELKGCIARAPKLRKLSCYMACPTDIVMEWHQDDAIHRCYAQNCVMAEMSRNQFKLC